MKHAARIITSVLMGKAVQCQMATAIQALHATLIRLDHNNHNLHHLHKVLVLMGKKILMVRVTLRVAPVEMNVQVINNAQLQTAIVDQGLPVALDHLNHNTYRLLS